MFPFQAVKATAKATKEAAAKAAKEAADKAAKEAADKAAKEAADKSAQRPGAHHPRFRQQPAGTTATPAVGNRRRAPEVQVNTSNQKKPLFS